MPLVTPSPDGVELAYDVHGSGAPAVVLVHGWAGNRTYWEHQVDLLAERHLVVAMDLGGHGESGLGRDDWSLDAFGEDVVAVVEQVDVPAVVLIGHSMGGDAVVRAARQLGHRVVGVVWVDTFRSLHDEGEPAPETVDAFVAAFRDDFEGSVERMVEAMLPATAAPALVERIAADMVASPRETTLGALRYAIGRERAAIAALGQLEVTVAAINPDIGPTDVDSLRAHGVEPVQLEGVGHFAMLEDPEQFNPVLLEVLAGYRS